MLQFMWHHLHNCKEYVVNKAGVVCVSHIAKVYHMGHGYETVTEFLFLIYIAALLFLFLYGCMQIHLVYKYMQHKKGVTPKRQHQLNEYPFVTVQLPVYNESLVIERLMDAVAQFDYPATRFEVQVLDDSVDDTTTIIAAKVAEYKAQGLQFQHVRRENRRGYKAGALQHGLELARGEFISLFDADFIPPKDFLRRTLPFFTDQQTGMVQTRWSHLNKHYSLLTHFQAFLLDSHFSIEQMGRNSAGYFINFSGTGGVWRKACMLDAGGWDSDTLTEDFDISYRAQLKGWKFTYLEDVCVPAELPPVMSALKTQQYRWIKGNAETARKHLLAVINSNIPFTTKLSACFHLLVGLVFVCVFISSFVSIPLLFLKPYVPQLNTWFQLASFSIISLFCLGIFHYVSTVHTGYSSEGNRKYFYKTFPLYLMFSMGISLNNAIAVAEGLLGIKSTFIRTPKFNVSDNGSAGIIKTEPAKKSRLLPFEIILTTYYLVAGTSIAFYNHDFSMWPYHLMLASGFGLICYFTLKEENIFSREQPGVDGGSIN